MATSHHTDDSADRQPVSIRDLWTRRQQLEKAIEDSPDNCPDKLTLQRYEAEQALLDASPGDFAELLIQLRCAAAILDMLGDVDGDQIGRLADHLERLATWT